MAIVGSAATITVELSNISAGEPNGESLMQILYHELDHVFYIAQPGYEKPPATAIFTNNGTTFNYNTAVISPGKHILARFSVRHLRPQIQALQAIEPIHALAIDIKSLAAKKHVNAQVAVAHTHRCDLFNARSKSYVRIALNRLVVVCRLVDPKKAARASCADLVRCGKVAGAIALLRRLYRFCDDLLKHLAIKTQIGNESLELLILFAQLSKFADLRRSKNPVLLFQR